jgi:predicted component of type VI protein secretion system
MPKSTVTFQVLEGIDKGRIFRDLPTPLTVGREEGNVLRLNDERVSRFHAKIQLDEDDFILTDLESTNGTKVNGSIVNIRRLRFGDRIAVGRSILMFGSNDEIAERMAQLDASPNPIPNSSLPSVHGEDLKTVQARTHLGAPESNLDFQVGADEPIRQTPDAIYIGSKVLPPLPLKMSASQAARLAEIFDFLHHGLVDATENIRANDDGSMVTLDYQDWQRVQAVQMLISRYLRLISEPQEPLPGSEG